MSTSLYQAVKFPITTEFRYPYLGVDGQCFPTSKNEKTKMQLAGVTGRIYKDLATVKYYLEHRPCVGEISASSPIFRFYDQGVIDDHETIEKDGALSPLVCSAAKVNHAVLIVGWGQNPNGHGEYLIIKNSFGD